ncbi:DUF6252 family protein [Hyunsoonleella ulvae]|uniref:DUF6252 family protein n=1 Tax=Hyunsoonleella ulvae TaxID=2799948 RepID=UPI001939A4E8|nr:DUF6252 family protein [Hyunsoonleella ulvae]
MVNGEVLLPKGSPLAGPIKSAFYQLIDGDYFFSLSLNYRNGNERKGLTIELKRIELSENSVIILDKNRVVDRDDDGGFGYYYFTPDWMDTSLGNEYYNTSDVNGEIIITNLNESQQIISGTFWFDAVNNDGEIIEIREGRF